MNPQPGRMKVPQLSKNEGAMSNRVFMEWIRREVELRLGRDAGELNKTELLQLLLEQSGPSALVAVGLSFKELPKNAILETLVLGASPCAVLSRWMRLERFSHTHNRTRVLEEASEPGKRELLLEHYALDGKVIDQSSHLFIWGALVALLERAGFPGIVARFADRNGPPIYDASGLVPFEHIPESARICHVSWAEDAWLRACERRGSEEHHTGEMIAGKASLVSELIRTDMAHGWKVEEVARRLRVSSRHLQRALASEGSSFTEVLHRTRIEASRDLLVSQNYTLTEIAFCLGYSDLAHYSRAARRYLHVAPSAFREIARPLEPSNGPASGGESLAPRD